MAAFLSHFPSFAIFINGLIYSSFGKLHWSFCAGVAKAPVGRVWSKGFRVGERIHFLVGNESPPQDRRKWKMWENLHEDHRTIYVNGVI